ncbi:trypsin-like peptidase [Mucilaginibacter oryzae]|uniref:Trypsin-like peptidase n=1 Tax=Mucilaginibacter oryzae TaxID=468058 RepID=A0A316HIK0_9SPHI|nr:serine protease [Mucilaginibacter oryzae]PWK79821.1 trypsin-like peptidase [Mucilaginibacter oryzae]
MKTFNIANIGKVPRILLLSVCLLFIAGIAEAQFTDDAKLLESFQKSADSILAKTHTITAEEAQKGLLNTGSVVALNLQTPYKKVLAAHALYERAKQATVITGCAYLCPRCNNTHMSESSGYIIDPKGIMVTNYHVAAQYAFMKDGNKPVGLFVRLADGRTYAVKAILTASKQKDLAILQLETNGKELLPSLPLADAAQVGDHIYVLGHPKGMHYFFSQGDVTNKYFENAGEPDHKFFREMMVVSADYATGSSGGPVLDVYGNVVGTVSNTNMLIHSEMNPSVQMIVKNTVPVESLWKLVSKGNK